ncbi:uncharacterized protein LOC142330074 [Lycorma delicatula]|uniref:uncharacterized protein LOC142330074 n=1 Tax=Lycorma delicatula TaxID=130591 RepID=UPI003F50D6E7
MSILYKIVNCGFYECLLFLLIILINISLIIGSVVDKNNDNDDKNKREPKQFDINNYNNENIDLTTVSSIFLQNTRNDNKKDDDNMKTIKNYNEYAYQGGFDPMYTNFYTKHKNNNNKNLMSITDLDETDTNKNTKLYLKNNYDSDLLPSKYTTFNSDISSDINNRDVTDSSTRLKIDGLITDNISQSTIREAKEYTYPSSSITNSDVPSSGSNTGSYKYPYPYSSYNDPGTASYYNDDKNYWQTAPPAITEKPIPGSTMLECHPTTPGIFSEIFRIGSLAKVSLLKTLLIAVLALLIIKIPALLLFKAILFKVILIPLGIISALLPVILPLAYFWQNILTALGITTTTMTPASVKPPISSNQTSGAGGVSARGFDGYDDEFFKTRATPAFINTSKLPEIIMNFLNSERCLERIACKLGARDSKSSYRKHVSWLLKTMQSSVNDSVRTQFKLYRDAYNSGASEEDVCEAYYPCDIPKLTLSQNSRSYRIM